MKEERIKELQDLYLKESNHITSVLHKFYVDQELKREITEIRETILDLENDCRKIEFEIDEKEMYADLIDKLVDSYNSVYCYLTKEEKDLKDSGKSKFLTEIQEFLDETESSLETVLDECGLGSTYDYFGDTHYTYENGYDDMNAAGLCPLRKEIKGLYRDLGGVNYRIEKLNSEIEELDK